MSRFRYDRRCPKEDFPEIQQSEQLSAVMDLLREQVVDRAGQAGRQDVLDQLPHADFETLKRWLHEL